MKTITHIEAHHVILEPGDGTHYEFLVAPTDNWERVWISSIARGHGCPIFVGYVYNMDSLREFDKRYPDIREWIGQRIYQDAAREALDDFFVGYAAEPGHSGTYNHEANRFTVVAAFMAALLVLDKENL